MPTASTPTQQQPAPCLDPFDPAFDPVAALHASDAAVVAALPTARDRAIFRAARPLNNVVACASVEHAPFRILRAPVAFVADPRTSVQAPTLKSTSVPASASSRGVKRPRSQPQPQSQSQLQPQLQPQPQPHVPVLPISSLSTTGRSRRVTGVLRAMAARCAEGPLAMLAAAMRRSARVRVRLRSRHALRGSVLGHLMAFDRHVNLVLRDAVLCDDGRPQRSVGLMLLRGEHVVIVCLA